MAVIAWRFASQVALQALYEQVGTLLPTYGHFTLFVCVLCGRQPLMNLRKAPRNRWCGRDLVGDRHDEAWSSRRALVEN